MTPNDDARASLRMALQKLELVKVAHRNGHHNAVLYQVDNAVLAVRDALSVLPDSPKEAA